MSSDQRIPISSDSTLQMQAFKTQRAGKPVVVWMFTRNSLNEVEQLLKLGLYMCKICCLLPGPLLAIEVSQNQAEEHQVEWVMSVRGDIDLECVLPRVQPKLTVGLEAYEIEGSLYANHQNISKAAVLEGRSLQLSRPVAVKLYKCSKSNLNRCIKEALLQVKAESSYTCQLLDFSFVKRKGELSEIGLLMERLDKDLEEDIRKRMSENNPYTESQLMQILVEISDALMFAKWQGVAHRDIKPANIFIDRGHYRLGDFGSACETGDPDTLPDGTREYLSPEMRRYMLGEGEGVVDAYQSDMYSLGVTLLHLTKMQFPESIPSAWRSSSELERVVQQETEGLPYSTVLLDLLKQMLKMNPTDRPIFEEVHLISFISSLQIDETSKQELLRIQHWVFDNCDKAEVKKTLITMLVQKSLKEAKVILFQLISSTRLLTTTDLIAVKGMLGMLYELLGRTADSIKIFDGALTLAILEEKAGMIVDITSIISGLYKSEGRVLEAQLLLERVLTKHTKFFETTNPDDTKISLILGLIYELKGDFAEVEEIFKATLNRCKLQHANNTWVCAKTSRKLAKLYIDTKRYTSAEDVVLESLKNAVESHEELSYDTTESILLLGDIYIKQERYEEAELLLQNTLERLTSLFSPNHPNILNTLCYLSLIYAKTGRWSEARQIRTKILDMTIKEFGGDNSKLARDYIILGNLYVEDRRLPEAEELFTKAGRIFVRVYGEESIDTAKAYTYLGNVFCLQGKLEKAKETLKKTLLIWHKIDGEGLEFGNCANRLGRVYFKQSQYFESEQLFAKAFEIYSKILGETDDSTLNIYIDLADVYIEEGKLSEADAAIQRLCSIYIQLHTQTPSKLIIIGLKLMNAYNVTGRFMELMVILRKCHELYTICLDPSDPDAQQIEILFQKYEAINR